MLGLYRRVYIGRLAFFTVMISGLAFYLLAVTSTFGDSDLPPYYPDTFGEMVVTATLRLLFLPLIGICADFGDSPPFILIVPLWLLSGFFWAVVIEFAAAGLKRMGALFTGANKSSA
jgi:hypothetical protein